VLTESQFLGFVTDLAKWCGWLVFHPTPALTPGGQWRTHYTGHAGFPDLVLVHRDRWPHVIFAELKTERGRVTPGQRQWLNTLDDAGAYAVVWRPQDSDTITDLLRGTLPDDPAQ
jgi:hypothetical protein